jgi:hypothetical protein
LLHRGRYRAAREGVAPSKREHNFKRAAQVREWSSMKDPKRRRSFAGAAEVAAHVETAARYLKELTAACANGDKDLARTTLRRAISELQVARAMLRIGLE